MPIGRGVLSGDPLLSSGRRDKLVTIQSATDGRGTSGAPTQTWANLTSTPTEWMSRRDLRADERFANDQQSAYAETQWHLRYRADMDPELLDVPKSRRLVLNGRIHQIVAATLMEQNKGIELLTLSGGTL